MKYFLLLLSGLLLGFSCKSGSNSKDSNPTDDPRQNENYIEVSRAEYEDKLYGFWLGACIANWTGLVTEMDKIGNVGEIKTGRFYTREDWGKADLPNIWSNGKASELSATIDFIFRNEGEVWGADDDTDIEYMYQHLILEHDSYLLTPMQIRDGWLKHIKKEEENYLWVSNQKAYDLMQEGILPPGTSALDLNEHNQMIDAQLTTEVFGLFAPGRPELALSLAHLPIRTTARGPAARIAEFYVFMHALASIYQAVPNVKSILSMADEASRIFDENSYPKKMYDFVRSNYKAGIDWEETRDSLYVKYQVNGEDNYKITSQDLYCNGCFAAGINFGASLISLFYGEGDLKETIKIGTLTGWDSDNPTATWGGMLGFMIGKKGIEETFGRRFSNKYNIHRTRVNFPNNGIDSFDGMARKGLTIVDRVVISEMNGQIDQLNNTWIIPIEKQ